MPPKPKNKNIVHRILRLCESIWEIVSPILTHDSPEGNLHNLIGEQEPSSLSSLRDASAQDFLSGSWRSLKEASALLGTALSSQESSQEDYQVAGTLFMEWLSRIRHRGAFSAVMPAYENLCGECFKDKEKNLNTLPPQWLNVCLWLKVADLGMFVVNDRKLSFHYPAIWRASDVNHCDSYRGN
jgi:hypothetical protein